MRSKFHQAFKAFRECQAEWVAACDLSLPADHPRFMAVIDRLIEEDLYDIVFAGSVPPRATCPYRFVGDLPGEQFAARLLAASHAGKDGAVVVAPYRRAAGGYGLRGPGKRDPHAASVAWLRAVRDATREFGLGNMFWSSLDVYERFDRSDVVALRLPSLLVADWDGVTVEQAVRELTWRVANHPDESWEVHETPNGAHAYRTMTESDTPGDAYAGVLTELGCDPWYVVFSVEQSRSWVRVAPKPGREGDFVSRHVTTVTGAEPVVDLKCAYEYAYLEAVKGVGRESHWDGDTLRLKGEPAVS